MMTREEAIVVLEESKRQNEVMRDSPSTFWTSQQMAGGVKNAERRIAALELALTALRPVSREQVEQIKGVWIFNDDWWEYRCSKCHKGIGNIEKYNFCPHCRAPMTDEAVKMVMERLEEMRNG